ncbi:MAG: hypothetical protein WD627_05715 [Actinomycetota bacterium]
MPDESGAKLASSGTSTPLHAYADGRAEDIEGDPTGHDIVAKDEVEREDPDKHDPDEA